MAAPIVSFTGIEKVMEAFAKQKNTFWKVFTANDSRGIIAVNFDVKEFDKSERLLRDVVENLNVDNIYTLETYKPNTDKSSKYGTADTSFSFTIGELPKLNGNTHAFEPMKYDSSAVRDKIELINQNASLVAEIGILKYKNERLATDLLEAQNLVTELRTELLNYEDNEEDEEDEEEKVTGVSGALAGLIKSHGAELIGAFVAKNQKKELNPEIKIGGVGDKNDLSKNYTLQQLMTELDKVDLNLHYHLYKLVLISQQQPELFRMFMNKLDDM